jgi:hypothetical protein
MDSGFSACHTRFFINRIIIIRKSGVSSVFKCETLPDSNAVLMIIHISVSGSGGAKQACPACKFRDFPCDFMGLQT